MKTEVFKGRFWFWSPAFLGQEKPNRRENPGFDAAFSISAFVTDFRTGWWHQETAKNSLSVSERVFTVRFPRLIAQNDRTTLLNPASSLHFCFFVFPGFFGRLKIGEIFVFPKKIAGIQKSKMHRGDPRDHITQNTLATSDSLDVRESSWEVRSELVHSHDKMSAQIVLHENLRCFLPKKMLLRCFFSKP